MSDELRMWKSPDGDSVAVQWSADAEPVEYKVRDTYDGYRLPEIPIDWSELAEVRRNTVDLPVMLAEFHAGFGQTFGDGGSGSDESRIKLHQEEHDELIEALRSGVLVAIAQELADVVYVAFGTAHSRGVPLLAVLAEVHRANMSKTDADGRFVLNEHGKVVKPSNFQPPDIESALRSPAANPDERAAADELCQQTQDWGMGDTEAPSEGEYERLHARCATAGGVCIHHIAAPSPTTGEVATVRTVPLIDQLAELDRCCGSSECDGGCVDDPDGASGVTGEGGTVSESYGVVVPAGTDMEHDIGLYLEEFLEGAVWESTPTEAAEVIVDRFVRPNLPFGVAQVTPREASRDQDRGADV